MAVDREREVGRAHAAAVVGDHDLAPAAAVAEDVDPARAGIIDAVTLDDAKQAAKRLWGQGLISVVVGREPQAAAQSAGAPGGSPPPKAN